MQAPAVAPAAHWTRGFEPLLEERTNLVIDRVEGRLPAGVRGALYRVGPGSLDVFGTKMRTWIDGDGMVSAFFLDGGEARFSNRYVRTKGYVAEQSKQRMLSPGFGTPRPGGMLANAFRLPKNAANTNVVPYAGRLWALWEGGRPHTLDPQSLQTHEEESLDGALGAMGMFSAHPHRDPVTGEMVNFGPKFGPTNAVQPWRIDARGRAKPLGRVRVDKPFTLHDFGVSASKLVFLGGPYYMDLGLLAGSVFGRRPMFDAITWHAGEPLYAYVAGRDGGKARRYELPTAQPFHVGNCFDDGADVVVDSIQFPSGDCFRDIVGFRGLTDEAMMPAYVRTRLRPDGTAVNETLGRAMEFPRINVRFEGVRHRYSYTLQLQVGGFSGSTVFKFDHERGETKQFDFGALQYPGEPVFVAAAGAKGEDEGYIATLVYDASDHHSYLALFRADRFGDELVKLHLPFHVPLGFHGNWLAQES